MSGFEIETFDDRDTTHLLNQESWSSQGFWNASNGSSGTLPSPNGGSGTFTIRISKPAIGPYYYGLRPYCNPRSQIFMPYNANNAIYRPNISSASLSRMFALLGIDETIFENELGPESSGHSEITVDKIAHQIPDPPADSSSTISTSSSSTSALNVPSPSTSARSSSSPPVGAIIGGVMGALAFLFILVAFWRQMRRRRAHKTEKTSLITPTSAAEAEA
uniref:Mid2 domain-containing protein n=1 Tax=Psilocybe cubensis TaxID=181762 RepID=A0A8H7XS70_PSICU